MTDLTDSYNTPLSDADEAAFQSWSKGNGHAGDTYDYDLRGAFKSGAGQADNGHFPDTFKKPNHPTFSDQSKYSGSGGLYGGQWTQTEDGRDRFVASPSNLIHQTPEELKAYFQKVEPNAELVLPDAHLVAPVQALQQQDALRQAVEAAVAKSAAVAPVTSPASPSPGEQP